MPTLCRNTTIELLRGWLMGLVQFYATAPRFRLEAGERPTVFAVARRQAVGTSNAITNLKHETVQLGPTVRKLLPLFDGTRTREQLIDAVLKSDVVGSIEAGTDPAVAQGTAEKAVGNLIEHLAYQALLVA
jgi:methyltransferase-like protein